MTEFIGSGVIVMVEMGGMLVGQKVVRQAVGCSVGEGVKVGHLDPLQGYRYDFASSTQACGTFSSGIAKSLFQASTILFRSPIARAAFAW